MLTQAALQIADRAKSRLLDARPIAAAEALDLSRPLKNTMQFALARRVLSRCAGGDALDAALVRKIAFELAVCTYKDPEIPAEIRFEQSLEILNPVADLRTTTDQEALGIAGAIHKRKWEVDARKQHLETSLGFYLRGYQQGISGDGGYTAVNTAFTLDLLADEEESEAERSHCVSEIAAWRRDQAAEIRRDVISHIASLEKDLDSANDVEKWWTWATIAEAFFGLRQYEDANNWLKKAAALAVPDWVRQSTLRQLSQMAYHRGGGGKSLDTAATSPAAQVLKTLVGERAAALAGALVGKVGLALSGGGFRAPLFHLGVIARLAELDLLRHIEVISGVSGGSVIGSYFYLEVRRLLQSKPDDEITREDYLEIVRRMERGFLEGIQRNIRVRALSKFRINLRMLLHPTYTVTRRIGELIEEEIYSKVEDGQKDSHRCLRDLGIIPAGESSDFNPEDHNWRRSAKVPLLLLNATTLNTCHNWQFTPTGMGEPFARVGADADTTFRFRRMRYSEAPADYQNMRLCDAVAASACVAGLLPPVLLTDLYPGKTVALVDGGVHDNQGTASLLDADCTVLLVSDGSRPVTAEDDPNVGVASIGRRTNSVLMDRLRQAQFRELAAREKSSRLRGLMVLHMKQDIATRSIDWLGCREPKPTEEDSDKSPLSSFGIRKDIQQMLSEVRTDFDSFNDLEAFSLMAYGYNIAEHFSPESLRMLAPADCQREPWRFLAVDPMLRGGAGSDRLLRQLAESSRHGMKIWRLSPGLCIIGRTIQGFALVLILFLAFRLAAVGGLRPRVLGVAAGVALFLIVAGCALMLLWSKMLRLAHIRKSALQIAAEIMLCVIGWMVASLHLRFIDWRYLAWGKVELPPDLSSSQVARQVE